MYGLHNKGYFLPSLYPLITSVLMKAGLDLFPMQQLKETLIG